jgi:2-polyprenyl-3-methyl-5-hydroxy-6-metoxy-1,4-benzoquinol methylase
MKEPWSDTALFDSKAGDWDRNPARVALANAVTESIRTDVPLDTSMNVLEFGCGTGLITLALARFCGTISAVDTSPGMLAILEAKASLAGTTNIRVFRKDLSLPGEAGTLPGDYDLVFGSMTLHHIEDTTAFLKTLHTLLSPDGMLAVADLEAEDGFFHDDASEKVHHGFSGNGLREKLEQAGFAVVSRRTVHVVEKINRAGRKASYPVFLLTAVKSKP